MALFQVIDDAIPKFYQDMIENELLNNERPQWSFVNHVTYGSGAVKDPCHFGFQSKFEVDTPIRNLVSPIVAMACEKGKLELNKIIQARSFFHIPTNGCGRNGAHIDIDIPHKVCLYYVNDSDGDTILYKTEWPIFKQNDAYRTAIHIIDQSDSNIRAKVTPKKGRVVLFDGEILHCSSVPVSNVRCIVNIDFS